MLLDAWQRQHQLAHLGFVARDRRVQHDLIAHLAVHLDHHRDFGLREDRLVVAGPVLLVDAVGQPQRVGPQFLAQVREHGRSEQQERVDRLLPNVAPGGRLCPLQLVSQDHQLRDHGVEAKAFDVLADALDGGVHGPTQLRVGRTRGLLW